MNILLKFLTNTKREEKKTKSVRIGKKRENSVVRILFCTLKSPRESTKF